MSHIEELILHYNIKKIVMDQPMPGSNIKDYLSKMYTIASSGVEVYGEFNDIKIEMHH